MAVAGTKCDGSHGLCATLCPAHSIGGLSDQKIGQNHLFPMRVREVSGRGEPESRVGWTGDTWGQSWLSHSPQKPGCPGKAARLMSAAAKDSGRIRVRPDPDLGTRPGRTPQGGRQFPRPGEWGHQDSDPDKQNPIHFVSHTLCPPQNRRVVRGDKTPLSARQPTSF